MPSLHYNDERPKRNSTSRRENFISGNVLILSAAGTHFPIKKTYPTGEHSKKGFSRLFLPGALTSGRQLAFSALYPRPPTDQPEVNPSAEKTSILTRNKRSQTQCLREIGPTSVAQNSN